MDTPKMTLSVEDAREAILSKITTLPAATLGLAEAVGSVASEDRMADIDLPPFDASKMDGFALRSSDIENASADRPITLRVIDEIPAGSCYEGPIERGECVRVMTGAPVPECVDAVVEQEAVIALSEGGGIGGLVSFSSPVTPGRNIAYAGCRAKRGSIALHAGEAVDLRDVGLLAECGVMQIVTYAKPQVAIIATGSELVPAWERPQRGEIRASNSFALEALVRSAGGIPDVLPIAKDSLDEVSSLILAATSEHDLVLLTGGTSNGDFDFTKATIERHGCLLVPSVDMKPGKSHLFGIVEGTPVLGMPGTPNALRVGFELFVRPALLKMQGFTQVDQPCVLARLSRPICIKGLRRTFAEAHVAISRNGTCVVDPVSPRDADLKMPRKRCNCLIDFDEEKGSYAEGELVKCLVDINHRFSFL